MLTPDLRSAGAARRQSTASRSAGAGAEPITVFEAATGEPMAQVPAAGAADVDRAVEAAQQAFPSWSGTSRAQRASALRGIAAALAAREDALAELMSREVGTPIQTSRRVQVGLAVAIFDSIADELLDLPEHDVIANSIIVRQPAGIVGAITPWNYPLYQLAAKVAPALAAGCTTVVKPSSVAPLAAFVLAEVIDELGLPQGVLNVVTGRGAQVGEAIAAHPGIDLVSLTGSTAAGARVGQLAAAGIKRVTLELGGKSAFILCPGADLEPALNAAVRGCFVNNGQTCSATTRLLVPRTLLAEVEERLAAAVAAFVVGDPLEAATDVGPLASAQQQGAVQGFLERAHARADGVVIAGGSGPVPGLERGYYVRPTVVSRLAPGSELAREEVFGPVLAVLAYETLDDAVALANDCEYGLSGAVWGQDVAQGLAVARRLRTGQVSINGGRFNPRAPFGGFRRSGVGRELGAHGLAEYFELTSFQLPEGHELTAGQA